MSSKNSVLRVCVYVCVSPDELPLCVPPPHPSSPILLHTGTGPLSLLSKEESAVSGAALSTSAQVPLQTHRPFAPEMESIQQFACLAPVCHYAYRQPEAVDIFTGGVGGIGGCAAE